MRASPAILGLVLAGCSSPAKPPPAPPVPVENVTRTCTEAAVGIDGGTKGLRPPESGSLVHPMRSLCNEDHWSGDAIECFATMHEGDLGRCAGKLKDEPRKAMFAALGGGDETAIAIARVRLDGMHVGVADCDQLFASVRKILSCERLPAMNRAQLGNSAADLWDLPTKLPPDAQARMAEVCRTTLVQMMQLATNAGCTQLSY